MPPIRPWLPLVAALMLGACGDIDTLWGGKSDAEEARALALAEARAEKVPVASVQGIEIGRTRDGFLVTAHGTAPGPGYSLPRLEVRRGGATGADGYVEYDFVATPPPPGAAPAQGTARENRLSAYLPVPANALRGAAGIRVRAAHGGVQLDFREEPPPQGG